MHVSLCFRLSSKQESALTRALSSARRFSFRQHREVARLLSVVSGHTLTLPQAKQVGEVLTDLWENSLQRRIAMKIPLVRLLFGTGTSDIEMGLFVINGIIIPELHDAAAEIAASTPE